MSNSQEHIRDWLEQQLALKGRGAKTLLARHMNIRLEALSRFLNRDPSKEGRDLSLDEILKAQEFFGANILSDDEPAMTEVPVISLVSAGRMMQEHFRDEFLDSMRFADLPKGDWIALRVEGDSMDRISPPDSIILVNRNDKRLVANACYIIADDNGDTTYKRYRPSPKRFEPVSTNPQHEPIFPENDPSIIGRVWMTLLKL